MKRIILSLFLVLSGACLFAQVPQSFKYQTVVRDAGGVILSGQDVSFRMSILQGSSSGTAVYVETFSVQTNQFGLATFNIGQGTYVSGNFATIDWSTGLYWVKVEIDPSNGTSFAEAGTSQLLSVPYALEAKTAEIAADAVKITGDQTIAGNKTFTGTISASNKVIVNVATPVNNSDAVNKAYVDLLTEKIEILQGEKIKDIDNNIYNTVTIGTQVWMKENLKTTKYSNGTDIQLVTDNTAWGNLGSPGYCWYNNDEDSFKGVYGALYNWYAASAGNLCPIGWHVPSNDEMTVLADFLGGLSVAGGKMKESGIAHWTSPNDATNESGFTGLPNGARLPTGLFTSMGTVGQLWNTTSSSSTYAWGRGLDNTTTNWYYGTSDKRVGFGVRCMKDVVDKTIISNPVNDLSGNGVVTYGTVDVNSTGFGAALFIAADGNYEEADADATTTMPCVALALETGTGNKKILLQGYIRNNSWTWIPGSLIFISPTSGILTQTRPSVAGQQVQIVGYAVKSNTMFFNPNLMLIELK
jgi:uncharacterized protein (TIGR02145 family)